VEYILQKGLYLFKRRRGFYELVIGLSSRKNVNPTNVILQWELKRDITDAAFDYFVASADKNGIFKEILSFTTGSS
jgi:hypothetical protein